MTYEVMVNGKRHTVDLEVGDKVKAADSSNDWGIISSVSGVFAEVEWKHLEKAISRGSRYMVTSLEKVDDQRV